MGHPYQVKTNAFTLIELLVVISIIAMLIGILLPALSQARATARAMQCLANERQFGVMAFSYANEYDGRLPYGFKSATPTASWATLLQSQLGGNGTFADYVDPATGQPVLNPIFSCPDATRQGGASHYTAHPIVFPTLSATRSSYPVEQLKRASELIMIADGTQSEANGGSAATAANVTSIYQIAGAVNSSARADPARTEEAIQPGLNIDTPAAAGQFRWRHAGNTAASFLFADGHAETRRQNAVLRRNIHATYDTDQSRN